MGLDKEETGVFNGKQMIQSLLAHLGLGKKKGMSAGRQARESSLMAERRRFEVEMRAQFLKLKEKGLGIRVFTL